MIKIILSIIQKQTHRFRMNLCLPGRGRTGKRNWGLTCTHCSCHFYSTQFWNSQPQQSDEYKNIINQTGKEVRLSLFTDDIILCISIENPQEATHYNLSINQVKLQDIKLIYRNLLHFYTLTMKYQNEKSKKQSHLPSHPKEKYSQE